MPPGARRLEVHYAFDEREDQVIDLGLFDPRGATFLAGDGFRGWSGSARRSVVITDSAATPGYLPGPIAPGRWHVILGLYRIADGGCACTVEVTLSDEPGDTSGLSHVENPTPYIGMPDDNQHPNVPPTLQERRIRCYAERSEASLDVPESRRSGTWFAGDLHCHSHHSDARGSVADIAAEARALGLNFVAIADHNTISQQAHLAAHSAPDFLLLPAQEVTTNHGHLNAWGAAGWLDFRVRTDADMVRVIEEGHRRRLFVSANHPRAGDCPWMYSLELPFDCFEVWNGAWPAETVGCVALWDEMLRAGRCVVAVGGSDYHMPDPTSPIQDAAEGLGRPTTWIYADHLTPEAILAGLRGGHASLSASPAGPRLWLMAETADGVAMQGDSVAGEAEVTCHVSSDAPAVLLFITTQGIIERQLAPAGETSVRMRLDMAAHRYLRAELREAGATNPAEAPLLALTNPLYGRTADL